MRWSCLLLCLLSLPAGADAPRATAEAVARAIEDRYYDAAQGARVAGVLREAAAEGRFDRIDAPLDLATSLEAVIEPLDGHFNVRWSPPAGTPAAGAVRRAPPPPGDHGVRAVRILPGNIGYLDLAYFADFEFADRQAPPRLAIDAALALLQWTDAVIIDVRNNGGGSPAMVGYLSSAFTPRGAAIYNRFVSRNGTTSEAPGDWHPAPRLQVPLYILISGRTGSAAEALAYTLGNAGRATLIGERSSGAANPGGPVGVGGGFTVFVPTGSPVSPVTGRNWEGEGVQPHLERPARDALRSAQVHALQARLATDAAGSGATEARWALEALQAPARYAGDITRFVGRYGELRIAIEDGALVLHQGRRPARVLHALADEAFFTEEEPQRRVAFIGDAGGGIEALELRFADGNRSRHRRVQ